VPEYISFDDSGSVAFFLNFNSTINSLVCTLVAAALSGFFGLNGSKYPLVCFV
jgi:hypothetical protein